MTETSPVTFSGYASDPLEVRHSTIGYPSDYTEVELILKSWSTLMIASNRCFEQVKIVNENDEIVPINTPGELCTRGYSTMLKYWDDEEKTKETITPDRWLRTG